MKTNRYIPYGAISAGFLYLLHISRHKWGNLIIDTFRDLWVSRKLTYGSVLYRDIFYHYGILPPYAVSFLSGYSKHPIDAYTYIGIIITLFSAVLIYRISRFFLPSEFSALSSLIFLFVFAFGHYSPSGIFNFIMPYSIASTFFALFILSSIYFSIRFIKTERLRFLFPWGCSIFLSFLSRPLMALPSWILYVLLFAVYRRRIHRKYIILYSVIPPLASIAVYSSFFYITSALSGFTESYANTIGVIFHRKTAFDMKISGFSELYKNIIISLKTFFLQISAAGFISCAAVIIAFTNKRYKNRIGVFYRHAAISVFSLGAVYDILLFINYFLWFTALPLLLVSGIFIHGAGYFKAPDPAGSKRNFALAVLFATSLILCLRIILHTTPNRYGFFLLPPAIVCFCIFYINSLPSILSRFIKAHINWQRYYSAGISVFLIFPSILFARHNYRVYKAKTALVHTDKGDITSFNNAITRSFWKAVTYLRNNTPAGAKAAVFPEGIGINYFSDRDNPTKYYNFVPSEIALIGEDKIINLLKKYKIDYILVTARAAYDYGYTFFGIDYGRKIDSWIKKNYRLIKVIGQYPFAPGRFGIAIYKRGNNIFEEIQAQEQ